MRPLIGKALGAIRGVIARQPAGRPVDSAELIAPYVDDEFYWDAYPGERQSGLDAAHHYLATGARRGYNPSPHFHTRYYLERYPDVAESGLNALEHYVRFGKAEGRNTTQGQPAPAEVETAPARLDRETEQALKRIFDAAFYRECNPDVVLSGASPVLHFLRHGMREGRLPNAYFDAAWYLRENPDVRAAHVHPLIHFARHGGPEGRSPGPAFDAGWYSSEHLDVEESGFVPLEHFLHFGRAAGYRPTRSYPMDAYLPVPPDLTTTRPKVNLVVPVTIVMPVYGGLEHVRRAVESVLASTCRTPFDLLIIDDASPDAATRSYVRSLEGTPRVRVLVNEKNLGFVGTVNRAFEATRGRDVVLLNSDTEVASDWLDRLQAQAWSDADVATVTPLSNSATICSYPRVTPADALPLGATVAALDAACARVNAGRHTELPTGVGFCMYMRRDKLEELGAFDAEAFGRGYGEENDYCQRAIARGYKNLLAADVFVFHRGGVSFGDETEPRVAAAIRVLERRHPDYLPSVHSFIARDVPNPWRHAVTAALLRASELPVVLLVTHGQGGGTDRHVQALAKRGDAHYLVLAPHGVGGLRLTAADENLAFDAPLDADAAHRVVDLLRTCGVARVHVHHVSGIPIDVKKLVADLGVPFEFTAHDYYAVCPRIRLVRQGRYCGEEGPAACNACLKESPRLGTDDIAKWRREHAWLLERAGAVLCPSRDVRDRLQRYAPSAKLVLAPHPDGSVEHPRSVVAPPLGEGEPLRVLVLGALSMEKGAGLLRDVAAVAAQSGPPMEFHLVGYSCLWIDGNTPPNVLQTGPYSESELAGLVAAARPHVVWFPALWPETFSYTLSTALDAGVPIVAPRLGAFPERLESYAWRYLFDLDMTPEEHAHLLAGVRDRVARESRLSTGARSTISTA